jgi:hypothetical protein
MSCSKITSYARRKYLVQHERVAFCISPDLIILPVHFDEAAIEELKERKAHQGLTTDEKQYLFAYTSKQTGKNTSIIRNPRKLSHGAFLESVYLFDKIAWRRDLPRRAVMLLLKEALFIETKVCSINGQLVFGTNGKALRALDRFPLLCCPETFGKFIGLLNDNGTLRQAFGEWRATVTFGMNELVKELLLYEIIPDNGSLLREQISNLLFSLQSLESRESITMESLVGFSNFILLCQKMTPSTSKRQKMTPSMSKRHGITPSTKLDRLIAARFTANKMTLYKAVNQGNKSHLVIPYLNQIKRELVK